MIITKNDKPINIGVLMHRATSVNGVPVFGQNTKYLDYMSKLGNVIMISPRDTYIHTELDALCIPGGHDVEEMTNSSYMQGLTNPHITYFFRNMWQHYRHLPTLGICMGMQAVLLYDSKSKITPHVELPHSLPRTKLIDTITSLTGEDLNWKLNSIHHQAFYPEDIDSSYEVIGISKEFGNVEVVKNSTQLLVQAHPEEIYDEKTLKLFSEIILNNL